MAMLLIADGYFYIGSVIIIFLFSTFCIIHIFLVLYLHVYTKLVHKKVQSNWPLNPPQKIFVSSLEMSLSLSIKNICFYTLSVKKLLNFITALAFVNERKKLSFVLSSIPGSQDPKEIRNPLEALLVSLGPILKNLCRNSKAQFLIKKQHVN